MYVLCVSRHVDFGVCVQVVYNERTKPFAMWMHVASFSYSYN